MSEMPRRMVSQWAKEEILDAISERFCGLMQSTDGMTVEEINLFRKQQRRVARFLGFTEQAVPEGGAA